MEEVGQVGTQGWKMKRRIRARKGDAEKSDESGKRSGEDRWWLIDDRCNGEYGIWPS
jgi:hypothetical protein